MPLRPQLIADIRARLSAISAINLTNASAACDIYEAYVFALVVEAAERDGAIVHFEDINQRSVSQLRFRTSPGRIFLPQPPLPQVPYTHAVAEFAGKPPLEIHQGIYVSAKSGLLHECDLAVLLRSEAQTCRRERVSPRCAKVVLATECKFYSSGLGISLARGFLGLTSDIWSEGRFFVSNISSLSVRKLLTHHKRSWSNNLRPSNTVVLNRLRSLFERVFEEFNARY
jgi:hypothetical protein